MLISHLNILFSEAQNDSALSPFLYHGGVCGWLFSSPHFLTSLSGSSNSWPRNKSRIVPFPSGFRWKWNKIWYNSQEETLKKMEGGSPRTRRKWHTCLCCVQVTSILTISSCYHHYSLDSWNMCHWKNDFSLCFYASPLVDWFNKKYVRPLVWENKRLSKQERQIKV